MVALNNVIVGNKKLGMKRVDGQSVATHNLFWANGTNFDEASNIRDEHTLLVDPLFNRDYRPHPGSPCNGAGVLQIAADGREVVVHRAANTNAAPGLGAFPLSDTDRR